MTKILPISKAREDFPKLVSNVKKLFNKYVITVNGTPEAVLMSTNEYDSLMETLEVLSDPDALNDIKMAQKELKQKKYVTLDELQSELGITN